MKYGERNKHNEASEVELNGKIQWYVAHRHALLQYNHQFLLQIDISRLAQMRAKIKKQWINCVGAKVTYMLPF